MKKKRPHKDLGAFVWLCAGFRASHSFIFSLSSIYFHACCLFDVCNNPLIKDREVILRVRKLRFKEEILPVSLNQSEAN
jgi:hypothetical protein